MGQGEKILVVGPAWIGDMVMAQSLYRQLRAADPVAQIDVVAPAWSVPLLGRMAEVHRAIELPVGHGQLGLRARWQIGRSLRGERYDRAIVLPRSFKSALIPLFAGARQRSGYRGELRYGLLNDIRTLDKQRLPQVVQRYLALGQKADGPLPSAIIPHPQLQADSAAGAELVARFALATERPVVALLPGAEYGPAKQWPVERFAKLATRLDAAGYQCWQFGSERDRPLAEAIDHAAGGVTRNLCGQTTLIEAIDLMARVDAAVSNDSGLMHVAAALGRPLVALYGSSTPDYTPPLSDRAAVVYRRLACSPCFKRVCPLGHTDCLQGITAESVFERLQQLLEKTA